ncbi:MAG TPA: ATP-binding protein [Candidatus Polarisedimenticolaceae bacterium]|nr:ATP-binding protein [Candidatus Polarisedimenticolaceae bacterium]
MSRDGGGERRRQLLQWGTLVGAIVAVSIAHYSTPPSYFHWHVVYQRLYYLPILFGAFWFGLRGGVALAIVTSVLYAPHIVLHWGHAPLYRSNQFAEIMMFFVIGTIAGVLSDRIRSERERHRRTAEELARAYRRLQETFERLRLVDRLTALGTLSAGMAHEIKNPLASIMGSIEILEAAVPAGDERQEFVRILRKEIQRLSGIVSSHLDLVRPANPEREPQDVGEIARSVVELTRKQAIRQGVELTFEAEHRLPRAAVDGQQIQQAILNLVINAVQALPDGGHVVVRVDRRDRRVRVVVEDDGPGLDDAALKQVFEPFFTTKEGGTGLGLSIAFQIADQHGGDLRVEHRPGGGARFCLELPVVEQVAAPPAVGPNR